MNAFYSLIIFIFVFSAHFLVNTMTTFMAAEHLEKNTLPNTNLTNKTSPASWLIGKKLQRVEEKIQRERDLKMLSIADCRLTVMDWKLLVTVDRSPCLGIKLRALIYNSLLRVLYLSLETCLTLIGLYIEKVAENLLNKITFIYLVMRKRIFL